jgi:membrane associated rhomboid family serine protease
MPLIEYGRIASPLILIVTVATSLIGLYKWPQVIDRCLFRPYYFLRRKQYQTIYLSGFVHADVPHLLFNMFTLYFFAFPMERHIGTLPLVALYFVGLITSHSCTYFKHKDNANYASLGASGAISAVLFAYIVYFPTSTLMILPLPIPIPAALFAVGYVGYSYWASHQSGGRINHDAHLCGAISGLAFVAVTDMSAFSRIFVIFA